MMCLMMGFDSSASLTKVFDLYFLPLMVDSTNVLAVEKCIYQKVVKNCRMGINLVYIKPSQMACLTDTHSS